MKAGWQVKTLGEVCEFQRGLTYSKGDEVESSNNIVLRANNIDVDSNLLNLDDLKFISDKVTIPEGKIARKGSLLICTASGSKSHLGKVAFIDDDYGYAFGGFMGMLTPCDELSPKYLFHLMTSYQYKDFIASLADGVNINNLKFDDLRLFPVPFPSISEQQRIVTILDQAFEGIATATANAEKNLANARELFESEMRSVFASRGEGWEAKSLADLCQISSVLVDPRDNQYLDMLHVGGANIESKSGQLLDLKTARDEGLISGKFVFDKAMVLYSKIRPYLMKVARPDFQGLCSADIYPLSVKAGQLDRDFLFYLLLSPEFTEYANAGSARAGMPKVNRDHLFAFRCHVPSLAKQKEYAFRLDELSTETKKLEAIYQQKLVALEELKKSILNQAFTGKLAADSIMRVAA